MRRIALSVFICCAVLLAADTFTQRQREFWSFQPIKPQTSPAVKHTKWARTPIDSFVLAKLEAKGIEPAPPADKITLLRRATGSLGACIAHIRSSARPSATVGRSAASSADATS